MGILRPPSRRRIADISTRWTDLVGIDDPDDPGRAKKWERLLTRYRPAMVSYARDVLRRHLGPAAADSEAEDAVQEFLAACVEKRWISRADPLETRRFRAFLSKLLGRFVTDFAAKRKAAKRRPEGAAVVSLDAVGGDPPAAEDPLEEALDREFARHTVAIALRRLQASNPKYAEVIRGLLGETAPVAVNPWTRSRARARFRECFLASLGETVSDPAELDQEWQALHPHLP